MKIVLSKGYSLVEVLVAVFIFGMALIPVFNLIYHSTSISRYSKESVIAMNLANELVNQICSMRYADIPAVSEVPLDNDADNSLLKEGKTGTRLKLSRMPSDFFRILSIEPFSPKSLMVRAKVGWSNSPEHQVHIDRVFEWAP